MWILTIAAGFGLICLILKEATDSFEEVTQTAGAGTAAAGILSLLTCGFLKEGSWYSPKVHFLVICVLMSIVSLKTKFAL
ncbi:hypothetical protein AW736_12870 [Termitidicoccus mucosus]|uniref:Uncharacterized protein n=2 Tax=Termitidicoccus mucosus TaxID=1184151 RepID=A0A178IHP5_9BACT|nr:hypothetical protein AW736_12870 [Opitutaceae bacterium TSB47]